MDLSRILPDEGAHRTFCFQYFSNHYRTISNSVSKRIPIRICTCGRTRREEKRTSKYEVQFHTSLFLTYHFRLFFPIARVYYCVNKFLKYSRHGLGKWKFGGYPINDIRLITSSRNALHYEKDGSRSLLIL